MQTACCQSNYLTTNSSLLKGKGMGSREPTKIQKLFQFKMNLKLCLCVCILLLSILTRTCLAESEEQINCSKFKNSSCIGCVDQKSCFWCESSGTCEYYSLVPKGCSKAQWYVKQCSIAGFWLIIVLPCVAVFLLVSLICCCWCCCKKSQKSIDEKFKLKETKRQKEKEQRRIYHETKDNEREKERNRIRSKYGLYNSDVASKANDRSPLLE
ncbi:pituitary tumor-transforming gene 1 protein-interacting protein [Hydra vulgaris]|uniref:pituitary tumor-transforming gene 1 protein-interacting protein n=1 Tax=Hydra vulgaris TaxID=6087 RepID=UPI001F5FDF72|nr:pituitary tumor-transforming gene 1 protein-interacting protein-like [Hydra vulgaris]